MLCDVVKFKDNAKIMLAKDRAGTARINACGDGSFASLEATNVTEAGSPLR